MTLSSRVFCSTITLRHLPLQQALTEIRGRGFIGIDLGALPGVCDHVPYELTADAVTAIAAEIRGSGLDVRSVNGDVGDLNVPPDAGGAAARLTHVDRLLDLCAGIGATALVLPNGRQSHEPVDALGSDLDLVAQQLTAISERARRLGLELWVEAPHWFRLAYNLDRAAGLLGRLPEEVGVVCDVSHITASGSTPREFLNTLGGRTRHVHVRDAEAGYIHHSVGNGQVDFPDLIDALDQIGYLGVIALELETRDVADDDRADEALRAGTYLSTLLDRADRLATN